jgi:type IV pilus assembly protein PilA
MHLSNKILPGVGKVNQHKGFTLIELMVVVAIVSILAVIALPAYLDYVVRSKVSEGMAFAGEAKTSVTEYYYSSLPPQDMPDNNEQAGLPPAENYGENVNYVQRVDISTTTGDFRKGSITVTFKLPGSKIDGKVLQLIPSTAAVEVSWTCSIPDGDSGIPVQFAPPSCRG